MSTLTFADTHNMVAFLEKPAESDGFHEIIDFLNANQIVYAINCLNPIISTHYTLKQFGGSIDTKATQFNDADGIDCFLTTTIFEELARMGAKSTTWNEFSSTMTSAIICLATNQKFNFSKYIFDAMTPTTTQPSSSRPHKKQSRRKQRKETEVPQDETHHDDSIPIPSNGPLLSGEDIMQLTELMILCTNLQKQVLDLEKAKDAQAKEIDGLKKRDKESLGAQEDASKQGRIKIVDETQGRLDDAEMFNIDDLHDDEVIMDMVVGEKQEKSAKIDEREVSTGVEDSAAPTIPVTTADEGVTAAKIDEITPTSAPTTVIDELTLAQTLIEIKAAKPKAVTTAATTTTTRPKARGVVVQEPSEFRTTTSSPQASQPSKTKDKGKAIMIEPEVPLKRKDQVALDEEMARNLEAQLQAELIEEEKMARKKEEEANIALIESWENTQAMMEADRLLAERLQTREMLQGIDREDLETLWKLVKIKHGDTRPEDEHERVWGGGLLGLKDFKMILRVSAAGGIH
ncbi:hypothetical protein Tco_0327661 [Tanacetum coccineum]